MDGLSAAMKAGPWAVCLVSQMVDSKVLLLVAMTVAHLASHSVVAMAFQKVAQKACRKVARWVDA